MGKISTLDCTLRDGGYINNWNFGENAIREITKKIARSGIEYFEIGFLRNIQYNADCSIFPDNDSIAKIIAPKATHLKYVGMVDMGDPLPLDKLGCRQTDALDGIRVIFKKNRIQEGYDYCNELIAMGYEVFAQLVGTDEYSDIHLIETVQKFNNLNICGLAIVDTFGLIKRRDFLRMVGLIDHNLKPGVSLCYHSHNNLQQAMANASALVEANLVRDIVIDACVFGMGRGAGNLNLELFAEYLIESYGKNYRIEPLLEIVDEYLYDVYRKEFWGYSLPYYLSATNGCHPNYAKHFAEKGTLTVKAFNELLRSIPQGIKENYSPQKAEEVYADFQEILLDDKEQLEQLRRLLNKRNILLLGAGNSISNEKDKIINYISNNNPVVISLNYIPENLNVDYVFCCHMRRYSKIQDNLSIKKIITSNIREAKNYAFLVNFSSFAASNPEIIDNSGIMCLKLLLEIGVNDVCLAGLDGYDVLSQKNYIYSGLEYPFSSTIMEARNKLIKTQIHELYSSINITFLTDSLYQ